MRYFSMFTGVGGFEIGIEKAFNSHSNARETKDISNDFSNNNNTQWGRTSPVCVGFSEFDKFASELLKQKYPEVRNYGDATKINANELPDFDVLVGGFPCQAFSIAGNRNGFDDTRGTLFFDIARIAAIKKPRLMVLENVKGLLSHDKGKTFATILTTLNELGYEHQFGLVNSRHFGVPQNRERIIIVANLRGTPRPKVFPLRCNDCTIEKETSQGLVQIAHAETARQYANWNGNFVAGTLTGGGHSGGLHSDMDAVEEDIGIRRLTPIECERLQGFPDNWTQGFSDTQRYKMMGNAVTTNVIQAIFQRILDQEQGE